MDSVHGYNLTMNEAKAKAEKTVLSKAPGDSKLNKGKEGNPKGALETAPGNAKMSKGKVAGTKDLEEAPGTEADTDFDGHDGAENGYDIGYNLREQENGKLAEAPESGKGAKETKATSSALVAKQNLAKAPGKGKEVDFEANDDNGYNLDESKEGALAEAPESGKGAKETKATSSALVAKQNLAKAPGKGKEVDFEANDDNGYNLDESEDLKKN